MASTWHLGFFGFALAGSDMEWALDVVIYRTLKFFFNVQTSRERQEVDK